MTVSGCVGGVGGGGVGVVVVVVDPAEDDGGAVVVRDELVVGDGGVVGEELVVDHRPPRPPTCRTSRECQGRPVSCEVISSMSFPFVFSCSLL